MADGHADIARGSVGKTMRMMIKIELSRRPW